MNSREKQCDPLSLLSKNTDHSRLWDCQSIDCRIFMLCLSDNNQTDIIEAFISFSRYLDD